MVQTLDHETWELLVVDNASHPAVKIPLSPTDHSKIRILRQDKLGLRHARRHGLVESRGEFVVLLDDDNLLAPDYLQMVILAFARLPRVGALGGKVSAEFEGAVADWQTEFLPLLNVRDLGNEEQFFLPPANPRDLTHYPACAPIGGGIALRRSALAPWLSEASRSPFDADAPDFSTDAETELILSVLRAGWAVGYVPSLQLSTIIPARKLDPDFLGGLNHRRQKAWMQVLSLYHLNPLPRLPSWSVPTRKASAFFALRAWTAPASRIRWRGACGQLEGRRAQS